MPYLLNIAYLALIALLSPWLFYAAINKGKYRAGVAEKWLGRVPRRAGSAPCLWLHAVSVGEVNLLAPLLAALQKQYPAHDIVISTTSASGHALATKKYAEHTVCYAPLDFSWAVKNALERIRPDVLILAELELWPNLIALAKRRGAHVAIFNGRLSERSFRGYRRLRPLVARTLRRIDVVAAQNETYAERFRALGAPHVVVTGSLKFDGAETRRDNSRTQKLAALAGIAPSDIVFLAGSTQAPEEELALATYRALRNEQPDLRLILVPRHPERFAEVAELLNHSGEAWVRRSKLENLRLGGTGILPVLPQLSEVAPPRRDETPTSPRILLVDVVGELGAWWGTAHIGFVGGSLLNRRGGQNMIEPAAYGVATCFGPTTHNFRDIVQLLLERDAAAVVHSGTELTAFVRAHLSIAESPIGARARQLVREQLGATARTMALLEPLIADDREASRHTRQAA